MPSPDDFTLDQWVSDALRLDEDERDYLSRLELAAAWQARSASPAGAPWGWLALLGVVAAFVAWSVAAPLFGAALDAANQVGLSTVLFTNALGLMQVTPAQNP